MRKPSAKILAARARSDKFILQTGADNNLSRYYVGGGKVNKREANTALPDSINRMALPTYKPGDGECSCGCGNRPGCTDFLSLPSVGEPD